MLESVGSVGFKSIMIAAAVVFCLLGLAWWYTEPSSQPPAQEISNSINGTSLDARSATIAVRDSSEDHSISKDPDPVIEVKTSDQSRVALTGPYSIQEGAFQNEAGAKRFLAEMSAKGFQSFLQSTNDSEPIFRVFVGNFSTAADAAPIAAKLKSQGVETFIRRIG